MIDIKPIIGTKYYICTDGHVYKPFGSTTFMKLREYVGNNGLLYVFLFKSDKFGIKTSKRYFLHKLVAKYFLENPKNINHVVHKTRDKRNNHVDNLMFKAKK